LGKVDDLIALAAMPPTKPSFSGFASDRAIDENDVDVKL
jgi:hypothetical protein